MTLTEILKANFFFFFFFLDNKTETLKSTIAD